MPSSWPLVPMLYACFDALCLFRCPALSLDCSHCCHPNSQSAPQVRILASNLKGRPKCRWRAVCAYSQISSCAWTWVCNLWLHRTALTGTVTIHGLKRPLNGDVAKLQWADNLTNDEKILLGSFTKVTSKVAGSQTLRPRIGHSLFGYRVNHGEGTFHTISPNRRHSSQILRFHRARKTDTGLHAETPVREE